MHRRRLMAKLSLDSKLKSGDQIEVITSKIKPHQVGKFAVTHKAK
jgi:(p)ppGpp synthase/HD superfamily hydrolase